MVHVPFKGSGDLMPSLLSGRIQMAFTTTPAALPFVQSGKITALAVTSLTRDATLPDVPTVNESGIPGFEVEGWMGLFAPAGTPQPTIAKLTDALKRTTELPEFRQRASAARIEVRFLGPEAVTAKVRTDMEACSATIRSAGIKLE